MEELFHGVLNFPSFFHRYCQLLIPPFHPIFLLSLYLGPAIGWVNCFYLLGGIGLILGAIVFFTRETPRRHLVDSGEKAKLPEIKEVAKIAMTAIPKSPALMAAMAGAMLFHVFISAGYYDQLWFVQERNFDKDEILKLTGFIAAFGGLIGIFVGGIGSDWFAEKTSYGRLVFLFFILLICTPFIIMFRMAPGDSIWIPIGIFVGMFQLGAFFGPFFASIQGLIPPEIRSTVVAFSIFLMNVIGIGIGTLQVRFSSWDFSDRLESEIVLSLFGFD